ncbi:MAG TPA: hypothetical protein VGM78_15705, partial [Ilumatobacteraceae bacterium]
MSTDDTIDEGTVVEEEFDEGTIDDAIDEDDPRDVVDEDALDDIEIEEVEPPAGPDRLAELEEERRFLL